MLVKIGKAVTLAALLALMLGLAPQLAQAATVTVAATPTSGFVNGVFQGSFDINPALSGPLFYTPFHVLSAKALFSFTDNLDQLSIASVDFGAPVINTHVDSGITTNDVYFPITRQFYNNLDAALVVFGDQFFYKTSDFTPLTLLGTQSPLLQATDHPDSNTVVNYFAVYTDYVFGNTGDFSIVPTLSLSSIADLAVDGKIDFAINSFNTDFQFNGALLQAQVLPNVPEPATVMLILVGLVGLATPLIRKAA